MLSQHDVRHAASIMYCYLNTNRVCKPTRPAQRTLPAAAVGASSLISGRSMAADAAVSAATVFSPLSLLMSLASFLRCKLRAVRDFL